MFRSLFQSSLKRTCQNFKIESKLLDYFSKMNSFLRYKKANILILVASCEEGKKSWTKHINLKFDTFHGTLGYAYSEFNMSNFYFGHSDLYKKNS